MKLGIFGGTFDPPHNGHVLTVSQLRRLVDNLLIIPTWKPKYKKCSLFSHRYEMCSLAFQDLEALMLPIDVTHLEYKQKFHYTYQTINYLFNKYKEAFELVLFVGRDWKVESFKNYNQFKDKCKIVRFPRPGYSSVNKDFPIQLKISSSEIRNQLKLQMPVNGLVPQKVLEYIKQNNLY